MANIKDLMFSKIITNYWKICVTNNHISVRITGNTLIIMGIATNISNKQKKSKSSNIFKVLYPIKLGRKNKLAQGPHTTKYDTVKLDFFLSNA